MQAATLREYDIEPVPAGSEVLDAFSHVGGGSDADLVCARDSLVAPVPVFSQQTLKQSGPLVVPHATGFKTGANPFLLDIVSAPSTSYVGDKDGKAAVETKPGAEIQLAGSKVSLVAAMQNRENVRIGFVASPELLSDKWWGKKLDG